MTDTATGAGNTTAAHTPAPWFHIPRARDGHCDLITDREGNRDRAFIMIGSPAAEYPILDYPHDNVQTANSRLIESAPELFSLVRAWAMSEPLGLYADACRDVINKIKGVQS